MSYPITHMRHWLIYPLLFALPLFALEEEDLVWEDQTINAQELHRWVQNALEKEDWWAVVDYSDLLAYCFPSSPFSQETAFVIGEAFIKLDQLEVANRYFTQYLSRMNSPKHFEEAIQYKFWIAEQYFKGAKLRLFGSHKMPKWLSGKEEALLIYDEVVTAQPHSEIAAISLLHKAQLLEEQEDYKTSLETLDLLIRRFPKHDMAAEAFVEKNKIYLQQCKNEGLDPSLIDLALVNLDKFKQAFPREQRAATAEKSLIEIREIFAQNLLNTGKFFQKTKKYPASIIYYTKVIAKYPDSEAADVARQQLEALQEAGHL